MKATKDGECPDCGKVVHKGDDIGFRRGEMIHVACVLAPTRTEDVVQPLETER